MALRNTLVAQIWTAIEQSPFSPADFAVDYSGKDGLLTVTFLHAPAYFFRVTENFSGAISVTCSPGEHKREERTPIDSLAQIPERLLSWSRNLRDELRASIPIYADFEALREQVQRHIDQHVEDADSQFTAEEADDLRSKLDELMEKFQKMQEQSVLTQQELNRLNQELSSIKTNIGSYSKGVWYKTAASKIWTVVNKVGTSKESRQVLAQVAQRALGLDPGP